MTEIAIPLKGITRKILLIRNMKVMLDRDLAELYGVETKQLKRAVRRNISRFPTDFKVEVTNVTPTDATARMSAIQTLVADLTPGAGETVDLKSLVYNASPSEL